MPCPGCGEGSYNLSGRSFTGHFNQYCTKFLLKSGSDVDTSAYQSNIESQSLTGDQSPSESGDNNNNNESSYQPPIIKLEVDDLGNPIYVRDLLQSRDSLPSQRHDLSDENDNIPFQFNDNNEERWELQNSRSDERSDETANDSSVNNSTRKIPFSKDVSITNGGYSFQIELMDILQRHKTDLKMHDEIVSLLDDYLKNGKLNADQPGLLTRKKFIAKVQKDFDTTGLKPKHKLVELSDGSKATVSLFDIEFMILSLVTDDSLMKDDNLAEGYDLFTGEVDNDHPHNENYGEVHTGDAWKPACKHYCGTKGKKKPISLIVFGDKTHTDLHGTLAVTPIISTLSLFNRAARNNPSFWRPMAYIPNLSHGKGKADKTQSIVKVQDEHKCLALVFRSLRRLHKCKRGLKARVKGRWVVCRVWIHFFIGDTAGNNTWLAHYNSSGKLKRPYRDCSCCFGRMSDTNPRCKYIALEDMRTAKRRKLNARTEEEKKVIFKDISKHDIRNALTEPDLPLYDLIFGPYRMFPPELLHTSGSGLIMYMFRSLREFMDLASRTILDSLHQRMAAIIQRQSERDFPRGSVRNGLIDGSKCQSNERRGNLFRLLCISYTTEGKNALSGVVQLFGITCSQFRSFIMLYLAMEEWMHSVNSKDKVRASRKLIAQVLRTLKKVFPRKAGQGHKLPKFHGMTKMQYYMCLFGSGMNFYGGPGESHHKYFVKAPAGNTQQRVCEFAKQIANRIYESMIFEIAKEKVRQADEEYEIIGSSLDVQAGGSSEEEGENCALFGRYELQVTHVNDDGETGESIMKWSSDKKNKQKSNKYELHPDLLRVIFRETRKRNLDNGCTIIGYTEMATSCDDMKCTFRAHPWYQGGPWYDWAYVQFLEQDSVGNEIIQYFPSLILGFIQFVGDEEYHAVIRTSTKDLPWETRTREFISTFSLSTNFEQNYELAPLSSIVHPLYAFRDYGGVSRKFFCTLPKRNWAQYFDDKIVVTISDVESADSDVGKVGSEAASLEDSDDSEDEVWDTDNTSGDEDSDEDSSEDSDSQSNETEE